VSIRIEHGDLDRLVLDLDKAASKMPEEAAKVVERGALQIKTGAQRRIGRPAHAPAYPNSISYDMRTGMRGPEAEIGPDKGKRQGALGNLLEYGSINNAPIPHVRPSVDEELPKFEKATEDLAEKALER
jgi:hypothetical protein